MTSSISKIVIEATTEVAVLNNNGSIIQPGTVFEAWQEASATANVDGLSGSSMPIAFKIPKDKVSDYNIPKLKITGTCLYPKNYPRAATCKLVGILKRAPEDTPLISSKPWSIALPTTSPPSDQLLPLLAEEFTMPAAFTDQPCPVPFRVAGDFQWAVVCILPGGTRSNVTLFFREADSLVQSLKYDKDTRLEVIWLKGPASAGPSTSPASFVRTAIDLCGSYPIDLLRLYLPNPVDLTTFINDPGPKLDYRDWWVQQSLKRLPASGFIYNTIAGKSGFEVGCCGGSFALKEFTTQALSTSSPEPALINSFDLAALTQLAFSLLVDKQGIEVQYNRWVCKTQFGTMKPGMPFGLTDKTSPSVSWPQGVNNPYFWGDNNANAFETDANRKPGCNARAWVEASLPKKADNVIDISWAVPDGAGQAPKTDLRTRDRQSYATAHIDGVIADGNLASYMDNMPLKSAQCFTNTEFGKQSGTKDQVARVGVYNIKGILEPRRGLIPAPFVPVPISLRKSIEDLIKSSKNSTAQRWAFNNASLRTVNVQPVLVKGTTLKLEVPSDADSMDVKVVPGASCVSWLLNDMPVTASKKGKVAVKINIFDGFHDSYEAFVFELTKYECDISAVAKSVANVGHFALQTPHSVLCLRGNLFIEVTIQGLDRPDDTAITIVTDMMKRLDDYLARRVVSNSQLRRPNVAMISKSPGVVMDNASFDIVMRSSASLAPVMSAQTSRGALVVPGLFDKAELTHKFWVMERFDSNAAPTTVTISGVHMDTFHPGSCSFEVTVGKQGSH